MVQAPVEVSLIRFSWLRDISLKQRTTKTKEFLEFCEKSNAESWVGYLEQKTVIFIGIIIMAALVITVPRYILPWAGDQVVN